MAVIEITEKNIKEHTKKCVVLKMHRHAGINLNPGAVVIKEGEFLYDAINRGLVRLYDPALDDPPVEMHNVQCTINNEEIEQSNNGTIEPKKLGPKKRTKKVKE